MKNQPGTLKNHKIHSGTKKKLTWNLKNHKKHSGTVKKQPGTMKDQSGTIKTNPESYRGLWVVQVVTGDSQEEVLIFCDTHAS